VILSFDLLVTGSWEGNESSGGPDRWEFGVPGRAGDSEDDVSDRGRGSASLSGQCAHQFISSEHGRGGDETRLASATMRSIGSVIASNILTITRRSSLEAAQLNLFPTKDGGWITSLFTCRTEIGGLWPRPESVETSGLSRWRRIDEVNGNPRRCWCRRTPNQSSWLSVA
jgi:hypothetical protein